MKPELSQNRKVIIEGGDFTPLANELIRNPKMPHTVFRVFSIITSFDPSYPSVRRICKEGGLGKGTVMRAIEWLKNHNVLKLGKSRSRLKTNQYFVLGRTKWNVPKPLGPEDETVSDVETDCIRGETQDVSKIDTLPSPQQGHNKSNTKKSNFKKSKEKLYYDIDNARLPLPNHFINEAITAYKSLFSSHFNGQQYLDKYTAQFEDKDLQETFVEQSIKFSQHGGTIYGRIKNEYDRLVHQKARHTPQPKFLLSDTSVTSYQMALGDYLKKPKWPELIYPFNGKSLLSETFDHDPEIVLATNTIRKALTLKGIEKFERWRWEEQPTDVVQFGPYLFHYYIFKCHLHFGLVSSDTEKLLLAYEKKIGLKLCRPSEELKIQGLNLEARSMLDKIYSPKERPISKEEIVILNSRIHIPDGLTTHFWEENQQLHEAPKQRDRHSQGKIKLQSHASALGGVSE